jgi:hypothetical protein
MSLQIRSAGDRPLTVRQSNWDGGSGRKTFQVPGEPTEPRFLDGFNVDVSTNGEVRIATALNLALTTQANGRALLIDFNGASYALERKSTPAVYKSTGGSFSSVSMTSGPTTAIRGAVVWAGALIVASSANAIHKLSSSDVWSSVALPAGVTQNCDMVGVAPDDQLIAWFNGKGLYKLTAIGGTWTKIWPGVTPTLVAGTDPSEPMCDMMSDEGGSLVFATSDANGSSLHEYFGDQLVTWMHRDHYWFYQSAKAFYKGALYLGARQGGPQAPDFTSPALGKLIRKPRGTAPLEITTIGDDEVLMNWAFDWGVYGLGTDGDVLWVASATTMATIGTTAPGAYPCLYRYEISEDGFENFSPSSVVQTGYRVGSPMTAVLVYKSTVLCGDATQVYRREPSGLPPANDQGYIITSFFDLQMPDHYKWWRRSNSLFRGLASGNGYRVDYRLVRPGPTGRFSGWTSLSAGTVTPGGTLADDNLLSAAFYFPHDSQSTGKYWTRSTEVQLLVALFSGSTPVAGRPALMSYDLDAAMAVPIASAQLLGI